MKIGINTLHEKSKKLRNILELYSNAFNQIE